MDVDLPTSKSVATAPVAAGGSAAAAASNEMSVDDTAKPVVVETPASSAVVGAKAKSKATMKEDVQSGDDDQKEKPLFEQEAVRGGRRQRKTVERFLDASSADAAKKKEEAAASKPVLGAGKPFGEMANVKENIDKVNSDDLTHVHRLLYGAPGKKTTRKASIRAFQGWPKGVAVDKKRIVLEKNYTTATLKALCDLLCINRAGMGKKEELIECAVEYLKKPTQTKVASKKRSQVLGKAAKKPAAKSAGTKRKEKPAKETAKTAYFYFVEDKSEEIKKQFASRLEDEDDEDPLQGILLSEFDKISDEEKAKYESMSKKDAERCEKEYEAAVAKQKEDDGEEKTAKRSRKTPETKVAAAKKSKKTPKKKTPKRIVEEEEEDDSDDDAPLARLKGPTTAQLKDAVNKIVEKADLEQLSKKKVRAELQQLFPNTDLSSRKAEVNEWVQAAVVGEE